MVHEKKYQDGKIVDYDKHGEQKWKSRLESKNERMEVERNEVIEERKMQKNNEKTIRQEETKMRTSLEKWKKT